MGVAAAPTEPKATPIAPLVFKPKVEVKAAPVVPKVEKKKVEAKKEEKKVEEGATSKEANPWKKVAAENQPTVVTTAQNWPSLNDAKKEPNSGGETKEKENEPKKDQESISTTTATEKKKKGKQVKPKPLDIDIVGKRNQGRGEKARPRNGRNKDKEEKREENTVKETVKEKATSTTAAAAPVTQQQQQQPTQQREAKPKKANRGSNGSGRGSNGRNKQNTTQQQPSSYPVDVTQQPWYPPYQAQVEQPQMTQMEPNHIILDDEALKKALVLQIEYYFSDANLQKDMWLRKKLEPKTGCLPLQTISSFKRVSELTMQHADKLAFIKSALAGSKLVEVVELNNQHYLRTITQPTKWVIGEGESVPPDSILPASASSVELHQNAPVVKKPVKTQQQQEQKQNEQKEVDKEKWNPDAQVFVPSFLKTKTPEPGQEAKQEVDESDDDSDEDKRWIEVKKPPKSVTPTTLNRPVKDGELLIEKEASSASAQAGTDLFAVASKPRPNSVSESDHREELDFELDGERDDSDHGGQVAYDTEDSDDDSMIPDEELPNVVLITKTPEQKPKTVKAQLNDRTGVWENRTKFNQEQARIINDGIYWMEQEIWSKELEAEGAGTPHNKIVSLAPDEFEKRKAALANTPEPATKEEAAPPPGPDAFTTPKQPINSATPRKTPRTPGKSNAEAPRFFPLPEKGAKS